VCYQAEVCATGRSLAQNSLTECLCVCVCVSVIEQSALGRIYIDICSLSGSSTFRHWHLKDTTFGKTLLNIKCVF